MDERTPRLVKGGSEAEEAERDERLDGDELVGGCPPCGRYDACLNVGPAHWAYCSAHSLRWWVGDNLFSSWRARERCCQVEVNRPV